MGQLHEKPKNFFFNFGNIGFKKSGNDQRNWENETGLLKLYFND